MKKLNGHMKIELTNETTGDVQTVEEDNMVTEALGDIFSIDPMGIFYRTTSDGPSLIWNSGMIPLCPNAVGGILLFPSKLAEDKSLVFPPANNLPTAYASNAVNSSTNVARGSLNATESTKLDNGYRFVWEFTPSQGNGKIAAAALTSAKGGLNVFGSTGGSNTVFTKIKDISVTKASAALKRILFQAVELQFDKEILISMTFESSAVKIRKYHIPIWSIGLNELLNGYGVTLLEEKAITCSTFKALGTGTPYYYNFLDGHDGYWYGFANTSGSGTMYWVKISKTDYSMTEGKWTLTGVKPFPVGSFYPDTCDERLTRSVIRNGYLYVPATAKTGIYKINLANSADVELIAFGFTSGSKMLDDSTGSGLYLTLVNDLIIGWDFILTSDDKVIKIAGQTRLEGAATPLFQYKEFLFTWVSNVGTETLTAYLINPYLVTINNLSETLEKTTEMTMKITYELTEAEST